MRAAPLRLEFAPGAKPAPTLGKYLLAAGALLLGIEVVPFAIGLATRQDDLAALAALDGRAARPARKAAPAVKDAAYVARVRSVSQVARSLTTPWADLLEALESAPQQAVALLAIEPSTAKKSFRLTAEAKDAHAMLAYLEALRKDRRLDSVVLISHQLQVQAPGKPLRFQLQAGWGVPR
jgi:hypothetical protein